MFFVCTDTRDKSRKIADRLEKARNSTDQQEKPRKSIDRAKLGPGFAATHRPPLQGGCLPILLLTGLPLNQQGICPRPYLSQEPPTSGSLGPSPTIDAGGQAPTEKPSPPAPPRAESIDNILKSIASAGTGTSSKGKAIVEDYPSASLRSRGPINPHSVKVPPRVLTSQGTRRAPLPRPGKPQPLALASKSWAQLFPSQTRRQSNTLLSSVELGTHEGQKFVVCEEEDLKEMDTHWALSLVGYVIGKKPYYKPFVDFLHRLWRPKGNMEILMRNGGFFIAKFSDEDDLMNAMEGGPWLMAGRPIVLRRWSRGMRLEIERLETIPVWIRFPALPLHMWGTRLISKLASAIGKPLYMDSATAGRSHIAFARVCVEISAQLELLDTILY
ncbi:hypothetical protein QJS10_CPB15g01195 [Acorus calamus]|uniref:DUF4283 domain-containing protein n=1 Tax=Acorus calamus TaxID=4465 RepID=A0AAV9D7P3_ACOCL|nr:hypothetical protein QJS10_CPB15g01195 [Acorus calamus]